MALPGLSLPGLGLKQALAVSSSGATAPAAAQATRVEDLAPRTEWRFEVTPSQQYNIRVETGLAEIFGVELAPKQDYTFSGCKGAVFTWQGCQLEISGKAESEYAGQETDYAVEWLNVHGMLETIRNQDQSDGPRVLVVGPDSVGKSSLVRSLAAWSVRMGRTPVVLNLDPREGLLSAPSSLTAVSLDSQVDVENGYGIGPTSGPTMSPVRTPLIYHYPFSSPTEKPQVYKAITTRMALSIMSKLDEDVVTKRSGIIIDTPGSLNDPKNNYDLIAHLVSEFSITIILSMGSERLASDLTRRFSSNTQQRSDEEAIDVLRISKPGGAVERGPAYMKQLRTRQIREYFFGSVKESLSPHSHTIGFGELIVFRVRSGSADSAIIGGGDGSGGGGTSNEFAPGAEDDGEGNDDYDIPYASRRSANNSVGGAGVGNVTFERVTPSAAMTGSLIAIKLCAGNSDEDSVRDSAVMGYLYVAEVDETRKRVRFLAPHPQRWGDRALVWGHGWPEAVGDLVA